MTNSSNNRNGLASEQDVKKEKITRVQLETMARQLLRSKVRNIKAMPTETLLWLMFLNDKYEVIQEAEA
jgi:hypothetical protein